MQLQQLETRQYNKYSFFSLEDLFDRLDDMYSFTTDESLSLAKDLLYYTGENAIDITPMSAKHILKQFKMHVERGNNLEKEVLEEAIMLGEDSLEKLLHQDFSGTGANSKPRGAEQEFKLYTHLQADVTSLKCSLYEANPSKKTQNHAVDSMSESWDYALVQYMTTKFTGDRSYLMMLSAKYSSKLLEYAAESDNGRKIKFLEKAENMCSKTLDELKFNKGDGLTRDSYYKSIVRNGKTAADHLKHMKEDKNNKHLRFNDSPAGYQRKMHNYTAAYNAL